MTSEKLLTVKDFAEAAGVSPQSVYKRLEGKLSEYVQTVDGQKMIEYRALSELYKIEDEQINDNTNSTDINRMMDTLSRQLDVQQQIIEALKDQLRAKDKQIEDLTEALKTAQEAQNQLAVALQASEALHAATMNKQLTDSEHNSETEPEPVSVTEEENKKSFWPLFSKKNK